MAKKRLRIGVLFGGRSGEHEVSLMSAASILKAIDRKKYDVVPIGISKQGQWLRGGHADRLLAGPAQPLDDGVSIEDEFAVSAAVLRSGEPLHIPAPPPVIAAKTIDLHASTELAEPNSPFAGSLDVIFPVLHGTFGEDGTIQGLLELADMAYVGAGVLGSAAGMDKDIMKSLFIAAGIPIVKHVTILRSAWQKESKKVQKLVESKLRYPVFVKPANLGSSVGISKAQNRKELGPAIEEAAKFDRKIVIEQGVGGKKEKAREIECAVLGNDEPTASIPGEIVPVKEFYDYNAKYLDEGSELIIPAKLTKTETKKIQELAVQSFQAVDCSGLARVDFLMDPATRKIYLNEINTMPGFTAISMYPKLWAASGLEYADLIDKLIRFGLERHADKKKNQYSR